MYRKPLVESLSPCPTEGSWCSRTHPCCSLRVPAGSPSRGGDVAVYVFEKKQPSLPTPFYSVLVSISAFMALSTVFHSSNSPDSSPLPHSVLLVFFAALLESFNYMSLCENLLM